jgi:hypothetical protein
MNYLFLVFAKHKNQEELVNIISNDISVVSKEGSIKYYYGPESMIFTFKSDDEIESLNQFFHMLYGEIDMVFMLLPYSTDNMSVKISDEIYNHLFDNDNIEQFKMIVRYKSCMMNFKKNLVNLLLNLLVSVKKMKSQS